MSYICTRCKKIYSSEEYSKDKFCLICGTFLKRYSEPPISKHTCLNYDGSSNYWLIPVRHADSISRLIIQEKIWAYGLNTPGRHSIKPRDWACFYLSKNGIIAHAQIITYPKIRVFCLYFKIQRLYRTKVKSKWLFLLDEKPTLLV